MRGRRRESRNTINRFSIEDFTDDRSGDDDDDGRSLYSITEERKRDASPAPSIAEDRQRSRSPSPSLSDAEVPRPDGERKQATGRLREWLATIHCTNGIDRNWRYEPSMEDRVTGCVYQLERGEERGSLHFQLAVRFENKITMETAKTRLHVPHAHVEGIRNWENAVRYCQKEETRVEGPWTIGRVDKRPGERTDKTKFASAVMEAMQEGEPISAVCAKYPEAALMYSSRLPEFVRNLRGSMDRDQERFRKVRAVWLYGPSGSHKTTTIRRFAQKKRCELFEKMHGPWWDGYIDHTVVLFDDFDFRDMGLLFLFRLLDGENVPLPVKGSTVFPKFNLVLFTSIDHPSTFYHFHDQHASWMRRLSSDIFFQGQSIKNMAEEVPANVCNDINFYLENILSVRDQDIEFTLPGEDEFPLQF